MMPYTIWIWFNDDTGWIEANDRSRLEDALAIQQTLEYRGGVVAMVVRN